MNPTSCKTEDTLDEQAYERLESIHHDASHVCVGTCLTSACFMLCYVAERLDCQCQTPQLHWSHVANMDRLAIQRETSSHHLQQLLYPCLDTSEAVCVGYIVNEQSSLCISVVYRP